MIFSRRLPVQTGVNLCRSAVLSLVAAVLFSTTPLIAADADLILHSGKSSRSTRRFQLRRPWPSRMGACRGGTHRRCPRARAWPEDASHRSQRSDRAARPYRSHMHPLGAALSEHVTPFAVLRSFADIQNYIRQQAARTPKGNGFRCRRRFLGVSRKCGCRIAQCSMRPWTIRFLRCELRRRRQFIRVEDERHHEGHRRPAGLPHRQGRERGAERHSRRPRFIFD